MKSYRTLLFLLAVAIGLVLMALWFPAEGIYINKVALRFPSLGEALGVKADTLVADENEEPVLSPEELLEMRLEALRAARDSEFTAAIAQNPARFLMPGDDETFLDTVFAALDDARRQSVRVLHYGDSQLEGDRMTDFLREWFQTNFSGSGSGLVPPVQPLGSATLTVYTSPELPHYMNFGPPELRAGHRRYGPLAQMARVDGTAHFTLAQHGGSTFPHARSFRRISVLASGGGRLSVPLSSDTIEINVPQDDGQPRLHVCSAQLPSSMSRLTVRAEGPLEIYGLMADGLSGVSVDNIGMRGVSGTFFTGLDYATFAPFFQQQRVALIIMQYGGNAVPYLRSAKRISEYKQQMKSQIAYLQRISPRSRILFIGPTDMAAIQDGEMKTYPMLPQVVDSLRDAALESGAAFWNMYRAMGGRGSMARWVDVGLAGEDYVHFTLQGSRRMSELLCRTFDIYYKYYRFRRGLDPVELPEDSLQHDSTP